MRGRPLSSKIFMMGNVYQRLERKHGVAKLCKEPLIQGRRNDLYILAKARNFGIAKTGHIPERQPLITAQAPDENLTLPSPQRS